MIAVPPLRRKRRRTEDGPADPLFDLLRDVRRVLAQDAGVPPYVVFHDSTLREIAAARPRTLSELGRVQGVGETKLQRYGDAFLEAVRGFG